MSKGYLSTGDVDYEYDMYKNRIRKFVFTGYKGKGHDKQALWAEVDGFKAETGFDNLKREIR